MLRSHLPLHLRIRFATALLGQYASLGSLDHALALFSFSSVHIRSSSADVFFYNVMIQASANLGRPAVSLGLYRKVWQLGVTADNFTFPFVFEACGSLRDADMGRRGHLDMVGFGYQRDVVANNALISMYGKCGLYGMARKVFDRMPERAQVSWSAMIGACAENGLFEDGMRLFRWMMGERVRPNRALVLSLIQCVSTLDEADEISKIVVEEGLDSDIRVQNAAMVMYAKCGKIDVARRIFNRISEKDLVCWSSMIEAYSQADLPKEALTLFKQMREQGVRPDYVSCLSIVRSCSSFASFLLARVVHGFTVRNLFSRELFLETLLISLYVKCGSLYYARKVFDQMQERNLISWSTMISGYGMHGQGEDALELFHQIKKLSIKPDDIIFVSVLSACSHAGLVEEGLHCFNSMMRDYGIAPKTEHYTCMVDLLGRAGRLDEAKDLIAAMPIEPDSGVWGALLGACRIHSNVNLAELSSKSLLELEPRNSGRYVLLSNIYLSSGKKAEANKIRTLMKQRGVKKTAGHTVIDTNPPTELIIKELEQNYEEITRSRISKISTICCIMQRKS